ncbi:hypothetical protein [Catenulispora sp. GAS73]|uniref:hypothetical protein n=1 Tax=Catenulispora sp. GAS73 TaxID=3156269 RepID=UPI0035148044
MRILIGFSCCGDRLARNQYSLVAPLLALHGVPLCMPELGGAIDPAIDTIEELMDLLGILARGSLSRIAREQGLNPRTVRRFAAAE